MFSSIVQLGQVRLRGKRGECSGAISYHYVPVDILLSLSDSQLWFLRGHFPQMHEEGVLSCPTSVKKGLKCLYRLPLIRKQRCVRPCHFFYTIHICSLAAFRYAITPPHPYLPTTAATTTRACCKYTIRYARGQRDERMMEGRARYFPLALEAAMTRMQESCTLPRGFFCFLFFFLTCAACKLPDRRGGGLNYFTSVQL